MSGMQGSISYIHLPNKASPPRLSFDNAFKAVVVVEDDVDADWQRVVSEWLVRSGCRYMMAWGRKCSEWNDSVDYAGIDVFGVDAPDDDFVMTTWHNDEPLSEVFWFSEHAAAHPTREMPQTIVLHIAPTAREAEMLKQFAAAQIDERAP
jgi:hypothetical protein